jgi:hypothetical protein
MNTDILEHGTKEQVSEYVEKEFKHIKLLHPFKTQEPARDKECVAYYLCASNSNKQYVQNAFFMIMNKAFPQALADRTEIEMENRGKAANTGDVTEQLEKAEERLNDAHQLKNQLDIWKKKDAYQRGADFLLELKAEVGKFDPSWINSYQIQHELQHKMVHDLTKSGGITAEEAHAEFEGMIGLTQSAAIRFEAYKQNWGQINAALTEEFKAGAWTSASAKVAFKKRKFDAEAQAAIAFGGELNIDGTCSWKSPMGGAAGLDLSGNCNLFAGAKASGDAKLSLSLFKGVQASLTAEAFAGVKAEVSGRCSLTCGDQTMLAASATAGVSFGAGGSFTGTLSVPIFGGTTIGIGTSITLLLGTTLNTTTEIHFSNIYNQGRDEFLKLVYLPTILKGYDLGLTTSDYLNKYYLDRCITRVEATVTDLQKDFERLKEQNSKGNFGGNLKKGLLTHSK